MAGCSAGGDDGLQGAGDLAADACEVSAQAALGSKTMALDKPTLAKSISPAQPDGSQLLKGPVTIEPGLATESKQTLECSVRFVHGKDLPDVLRVQFIW
jgi:hypothetical protein